MITKDVMFYKSYLKNNETITIRLRIIKHVIVDKLTINNISFRYSVHRNSVRNILNCYYSRASHELKSMIENNLSLSSTDIQKHCGFLLSKSRKPKSHSKQANILEEKQIIDWYEKTKVGAKRLVNNLTARKEIGSLTLAKIK